MCRGRSLPLGRGDDSAFTVIELMVVVLVMGLLSSIAVPSFLGARSRAQDGAARASLRTALTAATAVQLHAATWPDAPTLEAEEPALDYVAGTVASTEPGIVSVSPAASAFTMAARSASGICQILTTTVAGQPIWSTRTGACTGFYGATGAVTTLAGSVQGYLDAVGLAARFGSPWGVAVDAAGTAYVADAGNHRIRKIAPDGTVTTLAGSTQGSADGTGAAAQFNSPTGVAVDADGNVFVTDYMNHRVRRVSPDGVVTTFAGMWPGSADGTGAAAGFNQPSGIAIGVDGTLYVADFGNHRIRKISQHGAVTTLAGSGYGAMDGTGAGASFASPTAVAVDAAGVVYVSDYGNHRIRKITPDGVVGTLAGSTNGYLDSTGTAARFSLPYGVAVDAVGTVHVADFGNHRVRSITPDGVVTTLAGSIAGYVDGMGTAARFNAPIGIAVDPTGALVVADFTNRLVRTIT